jgi:lysophospholipase L1-like esterase
VYGLKNKEQAMFGHLQSGAWCAIVLLVGTGWAAEAQRSEGDRETVLRWVTFPDERLEVCGLPWFKENSPLLWRLPKQAAEKLPLAVQRLMKFPTGARIRFSSDTGSLRIRVEASRVYSHSHMSPMGSSGLDAYVDGQYWASATVSREGEQELTFFQGSARGTKQITIYLPSYQEVSVLAVGVDAGAELGTPVAFAERRPIVFYGSSIAQGACAGRPGMSYEAILARRLDVDFVNLGFSGSGRGEPEVVDLVNRVEACCYVFDLGKSYRMQPVEVYAEMLRRIRAAHPGVPIVVMTSIFATREWYDPNWAELSEYVRDVAKQAAGAMIGAGDRDVHLVDGLELLGPADADGFQEGVHPNDLGFTRIADRLEPTLRQILRASRGSQGGKSASPSQ